MQTGKWRIQKLIDQPGGKPHRLPYLITIEGNHGNAMRLRTSGLWPPPTSSLYAIRDHADQIDDQLEDVEECRILDVHAVKGDKASTITVVLDRANRKRCNILIIKKGGHEHVYFRTEASINASRGHLYAPPASKRVLGEVVVDTREKYAWKLDATNVAREALPAGDYALRHEERIVAVVERKSIKNMLANLNSLEAYHAHLAELATYPRAQLVIEATLADFGKKEKLHPMSPSRAQRALFDIQARHPNLQVIFAGNRKLAQAHVAGFFGAVSALLCQEEAPPVQEDLALSTRGARANTGGIPAEIRHALMHTLPDRFTINQAWAALPQHDKQQVQASIKDLRDQGKLVRHGHGRSAIWHRT